MLTTGKLTIHYYNDLPTVYAYPENLKLVSTPATTMKVAALHQGEHITVVYRITISIQCSVD